MQLIVKELIEQLKEPILKECNVVVMPHFCIDNLIQYAGDFDSFKESAEHIVNQGGGNLKIKQIQQIGGKAANFAHALASLGMHSHLIAKTNEMGYILLEHLFKEKNVDLSHVKRNGELAFTSSIELKSANIMISDPASLSQFGPENLTQDDEELIKAADLVCISDWGLNEKGTELANHVFKLMKEEGQGKTFFDPGDPSPKKERPDKEIKELIKNVISAGLVDIMSVNMEEAQQLGGLDFLRTQTRVDLHTRNFSKSLFGFKGTAKIPVFKVSPKRLTGAGDAWNAADAYGEILGFSDETRLLFANATATYYISDSRGRHPSIEDLMVFLENNSVIK